ADLGRVKGKTRSERLAASATLWKWIDAHGQEYGIGRPYLDRDPPHVAPFDGREYAAKRGMRDWVTAFSDEKRKQLAAKGSQRSAQRTETAKLSKVAAAPVNEKSKMTATPPSAKPSKVTAAPPSAKSSKMTATPPSAKPSKATPAPPSAKPSKMTAAPPCAKPSKTTAAPPSAKPSETTAA